MRYFDFSSWQGVFSTLLGLAVFTLVGVGIRMLMLLTIQQRQQRMNRQINERLRALIAAYKALGGSFTGQLEVDPSHLRELRQRQTDEGIDLPATGSDRMRRIRDAVEAALSDIILLGTEDQVRLASRAAADMAEGRPIHTAELVVSLRDFIREALGLAPVPADVQIPRQGPARPGGSTSRASGQKESGGSSGGGGMGGMGGGMGMGMGIHHGDDE
ncbi:hypothetical protein ACEUZ9_002483 [Paracoccus litorisediminis]|jgi:uncharacterized membrane protein YgcG|uniref:Uncharacterized protein n=1 Tax=Paracoccus litorisediminis TaxID=2006130 RepID=A0A844HQW5_9RHOB|nr:hypothetical protein [Paracoccus litorisediminis]MTH60535.1 hypothetical protein [Paracoccus litorisediminis]